MAYVTDGAWLAAWGLALLALLMMVGPGMGMPPLAVIQQENLAAGEILIGQVEEVQPAPPALRGAGGDQARIFTLRLWHVVKSQAGAKAGDVVRVLGAAGPGGGPVLGPPRVQAAPGQLVIVYANPSPKAGPEVLVPVRGGFSVVRLSPPPKPGERMRAPDPGPK